MKLFIDRDLGKKLGRAIRAVGVSVTLHSERYPTDERVPDQDWIKAAAEAGEIILTRDGDIRRVDVEVAAIVGAGARCIVLETGNAKPIDYLVAVMTAWRKIEAIADEDGPVVYGVNRQGRVRRLYPK